MPRSTVPHAPLTRRQVATLRIVSLALSAALVAVAPTLRGATKGLSPADDREPAATTGR